ncbi:MAG: dipeptide epimerase [Sphingobacteriales bacterium]|nr:dipeptide epimerase [Sphingobacteriales bacterium]
MVISHIDIYRFSIPMVPFAIATGTMNYAQNVFIRVFTNSPFYGVGECSAFPMIVGETQETCLTMANDFALLWKGKDPLEIESRMQELHYFTANNSTIKSAFEMALYDLSAKSREEPLYKFLGGSKRKVETDITVGIGQPSEMVDAALQYKISGASILKVKLGKNVQEDLARITVIRSAVGPDIKLRIDANQGWSFDDANWILNKMNDLNIEFCEQPLRTWYDDLLPQLKVFSPIKIMADESCYNHHDARKLIKANACNYINIKLAKSGGISEAIKIYETTKAAGTGCMIGGMLESRIALSANLHLAYACPDIEFFDLDTCKIGHQKDPVIGGVIYEGYNLDISDSPGIGADADDEFLKHCESWRI